MNALWLFLGAIIVGFGFQLGSLLYRIAGHKYITWQVQRISRNVAKAIKEQTEPEHVKNNITPIKGSN